MTELQRTKNKVNELCDYALENFEAYEIRSNTCKEWRRELRDASLAYYEALTADNSNLNEELICEILTELREEQ